MFADSSSSIPDITLNPEASMVTLISSLRFSSSDIPHFVSTSSRKFFMNASTSSISSMSMLLPCFSGGKKMASLRALLLKMSRSLSKGELSASSMAFVTRFWPFPYPDDMMATPPPRRQVSTSRKSRFMVPCMVMISTMERTAFVSVSSAFLKLAGKLSEDKSAAAVRCSPQAEHPLRLPLSLLRQAPGRYVSTFRRGREW